MSCTWYSRNGTIFNVFSYDTVLSRGSNLSPPHWQACWAMITGCEEDLSSVHMICAESAIWTYTVTGTWTYHIHRVAGILKFDINIPFFRLFYTLCKILLTLTSGIQSENSINVFLPITITCIMIKKVSMDGIFNILGVSNRGENLQEFVKDLTVSDWLWGLVHNCCWICYDSSRQKSIIVISFIVL